jgi:hypothetical protein
MRLHRDILFKMLDASLRWHDKQTEISPSTLRIDCQPAPFLCAALKLHARRMLNN